MKLKRENERNLILFIMISGIGIVSFFAFVVPNCELDSFRWLVMEHNYNWQFSDFFRQIVYASDLENIYFNTNDAPFPPLAYCFYHILWSMNPIELPIKLSSWRELSLYQFNLLLFLIIKIIEILLFYIAIRKALSRYSETNINIFVILIILSAPFFAGAIERGNIVFLTVILLLFALYFKDADSVWERELALFLIAIAAGLKAYPAVFGLLYIKEKRWKEALRLILYGVVFCLLPFIFVGGLNGFLQYMKVLTRFSGTYPARWTSVRCFFTAACQYLGISGAIGMAGGWLEKGFWIGAVGLLFIEKKNWKEILYLSGLIAVGVPNSYRYTSIYMLLPLVFFLRDCWQEKNKMSAVNYAYIVLFAMTFTIPVWAVKREVDFAIFFVIYLVLLVAACETVVDYGRQK